MSRSGEISDLAIYVVVGVLVIATVFGVHWVRSSFEAAAYNRITGKHVSTWDAMFVELRVQSEAE